MYALADCNNFFVSCERIFRPDLEGKPVIVLSGNDGCVIARSNEAKKIGIKMGIPLYQIRDVVEKEHITCFSTNFALYGDISARIMSILGQHTFHQEQYSIDECFITLDHIPATDQKAYCEAIVRKIHRGIGVPISIGIAQSKTLAKVASKYAKNYPGYHSVCEIRTDQQRRKALSSFDIGDVWGIGRQARTKLLTAGITNALQLADQLPDFARNLLHKPGLMTWQELNGQDVIDTHELVTKQSITTSRTFATAITDRAMLEQQIANFTDHCARQLRMQHSLCKQILVFAHTSRFRTDIQPQYMSELITLPVATSSSEELLSAAIQAVRRSFKNGTLYKKAGVILLHISSDRVVEQDLFDQRNRARDARLQQVLDHINDRHGKHTIIHSVQLASDKQNQTESDIIQQNHISPLYTTDLKDIITLHA